MAISITLMVLLSFCVLRQFVCSQIVTVTSLSPQPVCQTDILKYDCRMNFTENILVFRWKFNGYTLAFTDENETGSLMNSTDNRVTANLTLKEKIEEHYIKASILQIRPPLDNLNETNVTCEGVGVSESITENATIQLTECVQPTKNGTNHSGNNSCDNGNNTGSDDDNSVPVQNIVIPVIVCCLAYCICIQILCQS